MDDNIRKPCPNCSQPYIFQSTLQATKNNLPLFLSCGHSMCEKCIRNIIKFEEPIECKVCHSDTEIPTPDTILLAINKDHFYEVFPVNLYLVGELALQLTEQNANKSNRKQDEDFYINLKALLQDDKNQGKCLECQQSTSKMCCQCGIVLCETCFNKSHKNFIIFKNHVLENIDTQIEPQHCKEHKEKSLDYYCKDCSKPICMDCMMVGGEKSCKNHEVASMGQINDELLDELGNLAPKVNETFKRLTKTAVNIGTLLTNMASDTNSSSLTQTISSVEHHFSKLFYKIQSHKRELIKIIKKLKDTEKQSLKTAKTDITESLRHASMVMKLIDLTADPNKLGQINLSVLLEDAKKVIETPWYLDKEDNQKKHIKVDVNEDLCNLITDYIQLEGNFKSVYKLCSTSELGDKEIPPAPHAPVYPPELPKDVRQIQTNVEYDKEKEPAFFKNPPNYCSKSGSVLSLNSCSSDSSNKSFKVYADMYQKKSTQPVSTLDDSCNSKRLKEGTQEIVYISHIINPHNFYVQRACHQNLVKDMLREFRTAKSLPKPSLNHAAEGKIYLAFNKVDNMWQRCRVTSIDRRDPKNPKFHVFCQDFGSSEVVTIDKLRLLPPARVQSPYPLAINCALANCEPKAGAWTSDDSYLIQKIIDNKQAVLHIRRVHVSAEGMTKLECDLTTFEDGVSIAHALVFHERARMPQRNLAYPVPAGLRERPKLFLNCNDFKEKAVEDVYLTHVVSPDKFYVRKHHLNSVYEKLCEDLEQEYGINSNARTVYLPEIGMACAVRAGGAGGAGGAWCRGVVRETPGRARARVLLVDSGRALLVHYSALRHLHAALTTLAALARECHLSGVTPLNRKWNTGSVALMQKYEDQLLELHVEDSRNRDSIGVTLYCKSDPDNTICLNNEMIKYKFAVSFGLFKFNKDLQEQVITNKHPLDEKPVVKKDNNKIKILKKDMPQEKDDDLDAKDKGPLRLEAKILHYQSPSLIYISLVHQQKTFNELFEKLQKYFANNKTESKDEWKVGERCCAICNESKTWRRAVILELEGETAKVFYSDFASIESIPMAELRELPPDFESIGDAAIKCHLYGVIPAVGQEWPSLTKEFVQELLDAYSRVFITKLGNFKDKSMPVEIWVYHTIQGGALEPNYSEWRCINRKVIDQGLGVPDKSQEVTSTSSEANMDDPEMLSFLNVTGSVNDWLQLEPMPMKPFVIEQESDTKSNSSTSIDQEAENIRDGSNVLFISDWLPPEPFQHKQFTCMPTYIDNDGIIYLHDINQRDTLDLISKALEVRFKRNDPKAKFTKWTIGEPCVAQYYLDNRFYRGKVLEVNEEASNCLIQYVDFGNEEVCSFANIRKGITLHQIPIQAHKCVLNRIRPVDKKWNRLTLDYMHKSIVEKECHVKITGEPVGDITPIELKYDKLCINDHLVDFEMAVYTDGTKPVVRKFAAQESTKEAEMAINESDSGPDYIVEEETDSTANSLLQESFGMGSMHGKDWNKIVEEDNESPENHFKTYPTNYDSEFKCNICLINDPNVLELSIIHDSDVASQYADLFEEVASEGGDMPPINGIFENKACIALFPEDDIWYRATILQYSESKNQIKVRFVDYGNVEIISLADVREIKEEWSNLPPATISTRLHGIKLNTNVNIDDITQEYGKVLLDKGPFDAVIVDYVNNVPYVELRNEKLDLINEILTLNNVFLKCEDTDTV